MNLSSYIQSEFLQAYKHTVGACTCQTVSHENGRFINAKLRDYRICILLVDFIIRMQDYDQNCSCTFGNTEFYEKYASLSKYDIVMVG